MTFAAPQPRWKERVRSPLVFAFLLSIVLHLVLFVLAWIYPKIVDSIWFPPWLKPLVELRVKPSPANPATPQAETITEFVEVNPDTITPDAPEDATRMSNANTLAANPEPEKKDEPVPNIDGKREESRKTFDTTVAPTPIEPPPKPAPELKQLVEKSAAPPPGGAPTGETTQAKPVAAPKTEVPQPLPVDKPVPESKENTPRAAEEAQQPPPKKKFKTLAQAREAKGIIVEEKKKQEGGVRRINLQASENVKASPFGDYSLKLIAAVQSRWFELLDERKYSYERTGQVEVTFRLHADGHVTAIDNKPSAVGENLTLICILAIDQAAPFGPWPTAMRSWYGKDFTDVTFTFNYLVY